MPPANRFIGLPLGLAALALLPLEAQTAAPAETVHMDPFEVQTAPDKSYGALNSNSITAFNTELDHLPISADIFDQAFIKDVSGTSVEDMIQTYSAGAGVAASDPGVSGAANQPGDNAGGYIQLRGLNTPTMLRDSFMPSLNTTGGTTDNFDLESIEIINGPQALLYGNGGAGGVINLTSKKARIGQPTFGSETFRIDQYGSKRSALDYGTSEGNLAIRIALLDQDQNTRRININSETQGYYLQIAWRIGNTTIRASGEQTDNSRVLPTAQTVTGVTSGSTNYPYNGETLSYLLASGQGPNVLDGALNWSNVNSYLGVWNSLHTINQYETLTADSVWNSWLSTQLEVGYDNEAADNESNGSNAIYTPDNSTNPFKGAWTASLDSGTTVAQDVETPSQTKAIRFSAMATNNLFGGRAHSQSILGADFLHTDNDSYTYAYYGSDSNFNVILGPGTAANNGRVVLPKQYWPVNNGPVLYPLPWQPAAPRLTLDGVNYTRALVNTINPALISAYNPLGVSMLAGTRNYLQQKTLDKGIYGINYTQWDEKKLDTLLGFRLADSYEDTLNQAPANLVATAKTFSFSAGADYNVNSWLHPYVTVSDSYDPPLSEQTDPAGNLPKTAHGLGEEVGLKLGNPSGTISGSLAAYSVNSKNEEYLITDTLGADINPSGINGRYNNPSYWINVNRKSEGVQATISAAPRPNWRMRFSAGWTNGTLGNSTSYAQFYNDQFNENAAGQVTFADGTVVYVTPAYNSKATSVFAGPATANTVPLTVQAMATASSPYYINPAPTSGGISTSSTVHTILTGGALNETALIQQHGTIATGTTGLPISALQVQVPGEVIPGNIVTSESGDDTVGYPELSFNYTSMYEFPSGWLKGFRVGGTVTASWEHRDFYFYPQGLSSPTAPRSLFLYPTLWREDLTLGYSRKLKRVTYSTQINVYNIFNRYDIVIIPEEITGWTTTAGLQATFDQQPRSFVWTNTISF